LNLLLAAWLKLIRTNPDASIPTRMGTTPKKTLTNQSQENENVQKENMFQTHVLGLHMIYPRVLLSGFNFVAFRQAPPTASRRFLLCLNMVCHQI
jgi:hypothetical protein